MLKKTLCAMTISMLCSSLSYADNFYTGLGLGYQSADFAKKLTITTPDNSFDYYKTDDLSGTGTIGNLLAGYVWNLNRFNLATEFNASLSSLKYNGFYTETNSGINNTSQAEFTLNKGYGLSLLPGYQVSENTDLYARLGYQKGYFKYAEYKTNQGDSSGVTEYEWLNGFKYGLGVNTALNKNISLRLEVDQTRYGTFTNTTFPMPAPQFRKIDLTPNVTQAELDIIYHFA